MFVIGLSISVGVLVLLGALAVLMAGGEIPIDPPRPRATDDTERRALFRAKVWRRGVLAPLAQVPGAPYNRPLEPQPVPDDRPLPPPRDINGRNGE